VYVAALHYYIVMCWCML